MTTNESPKDRMVRGSLGALLLIVAFSLEGPFDVFQGVFGITLLMVGGLSLATGLVGWCPVYALLGISSNSPKESC
jgi:Inner membrane protein YgaP-like, transmembrane domain